MRYENIYSSYYKNRPVSLRALPVRAVYVARPGWVTTMSRIESDTEFRFCDTCPARPLINVDIYALRDAFLSVKTPAEAKKLFEEFGAFTEISMELQERAAHPTAPSVLWSELQGLKEMIHTMSISKENRYFDAREFRNQYTEAGRLHDWACQLLHVLPVSVEMDQAGFPVARIERHSFSGALLSAVYLDVLRQVENRLCARGDCGRLFVKSDPRKLYCSTKCARLATVRAFRARERQQRASA